MFRIELKLEALCDSCPESHVDIHRGTEFGTDIQDDPQMVADFLFALEFTHGWEVETVSYEDRHLYCPKCKAKRIEVAA